MTAFLLSALLFAGLLFLSAVFSGTETGVYSLSRVRLDTEARAGRRSARLVQALVRGETGLLITLLVGNNLMIELLTHLVEARISGLGGVPDGATEVLVTALLTPVLFLTGELLPKDLFRRHPHLLLGLTAPVVALARLAFFPVAKPLEWMSRGLESLLGVRERDLRRALSRDQLREILRESAAEGVLPPQAEELAHNVLTLRETPIEAVMVPWERVLTVPVDDDAGPEGGGDAAERARDRARDTVRDASYSRLPAIRTIDGSAVVVGYVHQLDVLAAEGPEWTPLIREIPSLRPGLAIDRALARLRGSGQRLALVGTPEEPLGLVTLMDVVGAIAGDLAA